MNPMPMLCTVCRTLDSIVLRPSVTMSLSAHNRRTGASSPTESFSLSAGITLLRAVIFLGSLVMTVSAVSVFLRARARKKRKRNAIRGKRRSKTVYES